MEQIEYHGHTIEIRGEAPAEVLLIDGKQISFQKLENIYAIQENAYQPRQTLLETAKAYIDTILVR